MSFTIWIQFLSSDFESLVRITLPSPNQTLQNDDEKNDECRSYNAGTDLEETNGSLLTKAQMRRFYEDASILNALTDIKLVDRPLFIWFSPNYSGASSTNGRNIKLFLEKVNMFVFNVFQLLTPNLPKYPTKAKPL